MILRVFISSSEVLATNYYSLEAGVVTDFKNTRSRITQSLETIFQKYGMSARQISIHLGMSDGYIGKYMQIAKDHSDNSVALELASLLERFASGSLRWSDLPAEFAKGENSNRRNWNRPIPQSVKPKQTRMKRKTDGETANATPPPQGETPSAAKASAPVATDEAAPKRKRGRPPLSAVPSVQPHAARPRMAKAAQGTGAQGLPIVASPPPQTSEPDAFYRQAPPPAQPTTDSVHWAMAAQISREVRLIMLMHKFFDLHEFFTTLRCGFREVIHHVMNGLFVRQELMSEAISSYRLHYALLRNANPTIQHEFEQFQESLSILGRIDPTFYPPDTSTTKKSKASTTASTVTETKKNLPTQPEPMITKRGRGRPRKTPLNGESSHA